jgi:hypothetical protein
MTAILEPALIVFIAVIVAFIVIVIASLPARSWREATGSARPDPAAPTRVSVMIAHLAAPQGADGPPHRPPPPPRRDAAAASR